MLNIDEIRKEVAIRHSVVLSKDDPVLATAIINDIVLEHYINMVSAQYAEANRKMTIALQQQVEQSKETASRVITDASEFVASEMRNAVKAALDEGLNQIIHHQSMSLKAATTAHEAAMNATKENKEALIAAIFSVVAAIVSLIVIFGWLV